MPNVRIDCSDIRSWPDFHSVFAKTFGFPDHYGRNLDAWIDCMTDVGNRTTGESGVECKSVEYVTMVLDGADLLSDHMYQTLLDLTAFVNWRRTEDGARALLVVAAQRRAQPPR